jgi:FkbM family methyltransferase
VNPKYPVYIISKGRHESRLTYRALVTMQVPCRVVVEPQELDDYATVIPEADLLALPFSNLGQGSIPARNWVWQHSIDEGHARHWIMDDNLISFYRFNKNRKIKAGDGTILKAAEDFTDRYANVPMSGLQYESLAPRRNSLPPFLSNTRVYSCILLSNAPEHRLMWRGRYNEDTDLSLRFLKAGWCTILFNAFLAKKIATMRMKGGNTDKLYQQDEHIDGRWLMSESLRKQHPDVVTTSVKWGRWQHHVNYKPFAKNKLIKRADLDIKTGINDYGMSIKSVAFQEPSQEAKQAVEFVSNSFTGGHYAIRGKDSKKPFTNPMASCKVVELKGSDIVADIGAYVGEYSLWAAPQVAKVIAYEASPYTYEVLQKNCAEVSKAKDKIFTYNKAVTGGDETKVTLFLSKGIGATNSIAKSKGKADKIVVDAISYDKAVEGATVVKIDAEGAEYSFDIIKPHLRAIILEFHPLSGEDWQEKASEIMRQIKSAGFKPLLVPQFKNGWDTNSAWLRHFPLPNNIGI